MSTNFSCGERIKELRTARALSQERLALNAGITPVYLGQVERGQKNATVNTIEQICRAMNVSLAEFFSTGEMKSNENEKISNQILCQLSGLSDNEKLQILQIVKTVIQFRDNSPDEKTIK